MRSQITRNDEPLAGAGDERDGPISWQPSVAFLKYLTTALLVGAVGYTIVLRLAVPDQPDRVVRPALVMLVALAGWYFLRRGNNRATIKTLAYGAWAVTTIICILHGGVRTPLAFAYPVYILMIGWLISLRAAVVVAGLTVAVIAGLVVGESWAVLPIAQTTPAVLHAVIQVCVVIVSTLLIRALVGAYRSRLNELHHIGQDLRAGTAELQASKAALYRAQAVAKVGNWEYDFAIDTLTLSPESCRILGFPEGTKSSYDNYMARLHPDDLEGVQVAWQAAQRGEAFDIEHRFVIGQSNHWVRQKAELRFAPDGKPLSAVGIVQDITERKQTEDALRASTDSMNDAQRIAKLGSWNLDLVNGQLNWSDEIFRLFEIEPTRFGATYEAFLAAIHPQDRDGVNRAYTESLVNRTPYEVTHRLLMADGRIKWVHEQCRSDFDAAGKPLRSQGTVQDVTELVLAEQQLHIAAAAFESLQAMIITDVKGVILRVNQAFTTITGYTVEEAVGQTSRLLNSDRHDADFYAKMWDSIRNTGGWQGEVWYRRKNGEEYPVWLTVSAVRDSLGKVTHYVGAQFDLSDRKKAEEEIAELAFSDQLTGLPNRRLLLDRLKQTMTASERSGCNGALLLIDLDFFKTLNDTRGHDMGDLLLKQVAQRLIDCVRVEDTLARLGGDEFVVMLANLSTCGTEAATQTELVGRKILSAINQEYQLGDVTYNITASIGATLFSGLLTTIDELMKQADLAMYKSKDTGRNALHFFDPAMETAVVMRAGMEANLRQAIVNQQFVLYYQAQVVDDGSVTGAETLVRWNQPDRGIVAPGEFIALCEETGLILPLGQWILETACSQLARWADQPEMAYLTLSVNVSARQFRQPDFVDQVLAVLKRTRANPRRLKLELTESLLVSNVEDVIVKMFALKAKGVGFSLDDFGTGYSSLTYLRRLPIDQLKIDQSFVRDVLSDPNDAVIAKTIIALAHSLGLGVIAEGVETASQRDFLVSAGCHAFQGYFFSRPLPLDGFEAFAVRRAAASP